MSRIFVVKKLIKNGNKIVFDSERTSGVGMKMLALLAKIDCNLGKNSKYAIFDENQSGMEN